jgi:uroporphyrinogen decarboxylase
MWLRGGEQMLVDLILNPEFVHALMRSLLEVNLAATKRFLEITGPYLEVVRTADDLASQDAPLMSPAAYREMIKPYQQQYYQLIKQYTDAKILLHCCGNPTPLLDDLIEAGVDIWRTVQLRGIKNYYELKDRYGERLTFWGAIDVQQLLPHGTPEDVREEVRLRIREFASGGGYVVAATHNIQADVPPQNVLAMAEAVREHGVYPIA